MNNTQALQRTDSNNPDPDLISTAPAIEGVEKIGDWIEHREIVVEELCPVGALETLYAERAALYLWRLDRVIGFENAAKIGEIEVGAGKSLEDSQESRVKRDSPDQASLQTLIKYEAHIVRCLSSTMAELRRLQKDRRQGLREVNSGERGADRAGVCQHDLDEKGSNDGSPSPQITRPEMSIPGGRGADRAGVCQHDLDEKGSHDGSPSRQITRAEVSIPGGRGADRAGVCQNQQIKDGSSGGSPSQTGSPFQQKSPMQTASGKQRNSATRKHVSSQRAAPIPKTPPLLASITNRRRLEEYTLGEIFEPRSVSSTLNFAMIPSK